MREKIYNIISKIYGIALSISFWAGLLPLIPFVIAIIIGGTIGEAISNFLYKEYYPWVIALASISVLIGLLGMYIGGKEAFSTKSFKKKKEDKEKSEEEKE